VALLVARRTNDRKVAGSRPTKVVCITVLTGNHLWWTARCGRPPLLRPSCRKLEFRLSALMDSDLAWVNGKSGRQSWRDHADAFQRSIISEAIYHFTCNCTADAEACSSSNAVLLANNPQTYINAHDSHRMEPGSTQWFHSVNISWPRTWVNQTEEHLRLYWHITVNFHSLNLQPDPSKMQCCQLSPSWSSWQTAWRQCWEAAVSRVQHTIIRHWLTSTTNQTASDDNHDCDCLIWQYWVFRDPSH